MILRVVDQGLDGRVAGEALRDVQFAVGKAEVREPARVRLDPLELMRVHQDHKLRPRRHGRDRAAPAQRLGPGAFVAHHAGHARTIGPGRRHDQR